MIEPCSQENRSWAYPPDVEARRNMAEQVLLLPKGDSWQISLMVCSLIVL